jgi:hypothetical protein
MKIHASLLLVSLALAGCSGGNSTGAVAQGGSAPAAAQATEESQAAKEGLARMAAADAAEKAKVRQADKEFGEAATLLGADPVPTIRGRTETCFSGDKKAFASFYVPEMASAFATNSEVSKVLEIDFHHECGDMTASQPRPDLDALFKSVKVFAKRSELQDGLTGNPIYRLCVTDKGQEYCARPGSNWTNSVVVRNGRVLFVD